MLFSSLEFLFAYLPIVLLVYFIAPVKLRNLWILLVSLFFYGWVEPVYVFLMIFTVLFDYVCGYFVGKYSEYREYIKEQEAEEAARAKAIAEKQAKQQAATKNNATTATTATPQQRKKLSYKEQRELEALEIEIPKLEAEKSALEEGLSSGTLSHEELSSAATRIGEIINTLEEKEMRWLELSEI